jgi:hypothetical protein
VTIPDDVWNMYNFDENESTTVDFSQKSSNSNWWNAVDLISINASDNEIESLDERLGTFVTVKHIDASIIYEMTLLLSLTCFYNYSSAIIRFRHYLYPLTNWRI